MRKRHQTHIERRRRDRGERHQHSGERPEDVNFRRRERRAAEAADANADANATALAVVRSAVPPDVRPGWTVARLVERGLPQKLASRVLRVRALWLVRICVAIKQ